MHLALYRKYRPQIFEDVTSQDYITITLKNQVQLNKVSHAYIFTGSRGTGKTTCAKILSKAINCLNPQQGDPCLECEVCIGIENGSILDVVEIDAASNNGVDNIRDLREQANYLPAICKYKVYIIDEVHMLSTGAFNALLKIMEEPPKHIVFILATTELHKVPSTIVSRCQRFDFNRIKLENIIQRLEFVAKQQNINIESDAINLIARIAEGGMRDALSILDQCCCVRDNITLKDVEGIVGIVGQKYLNKLAINIKDKNCSEAIKIIDELYFMSKDFERLCEELIVYFRNLMIAKTVDNPGEVIIMTKDDYNELTDLSKQYTIDNVLYVLSCLQNCLDKISKSCSKRIVFELTIISLCSQNQLQQDTKLLQKIKAIETKISNGKLENNSNNQQNQNDFNDKLTNTNDKIYKNLDPKNLKIVENWAEIVNSLSTIDKPLQGLLLGSRAYVFEDYMFIDSPNNMLSKMLKQEGSSGRLNECIQQHLNRRFKLMFKNNKTEKQSSPSIIDNIAKQAEQNGIDVKYK